MSALLEVRNVRKWYPVGRRLFRAADAFVKAVDDVTIEVRDGDTLAVVGESGCGKTTMARLIVRLLEPDGGSIVFDGQDVSRIAHRDLKPYRRQVQMIFQNPYESLNPRKTIQHILTQPFLIHGLCRPAEARARAIELLEKVGLRPGAEYLERYPHQFSGGQRQRIGIARSLALRPRLVVADEPVSSLDVSVRGEILNLLRELQDDFGLSYLFITHDLSLVRSFCNRVVVMYLGKIVEQGSVEAIFARPRHPYTRALLSAIPWPDPVVARRMRRMPLAGDVPSPINPPPGCAFHPRCPYADERCRAEAPLLVEQAPGHRAACHYPERVEPLFTQ